jgi:hypothetical protein
MGLDNGTRNRQTHAHALRLCREKRLEHLLEFLNGNAGTDIRYRERQAELPSRAVETLIRLSTLGMPDIASMALTIRFRMTC